EKFAFLGNQGIHLFPQDGSGISADGIVVASGAVEDQVPDIAAARAKSVPVVTRAQLLAQLFNDARVRIGVAGTSGKSTVTGMIGHILMAAGKDPTIMNGAVMNNLVSADAPFASARVGGASLFVSEVDESDGSITQYIPTIAVVNNIALDHKTLAELRVLFSDFAAKAGLAVLNLDNHETAKLVADLPPERTIAYSLKKKSADLLASAITPEPDGISFHVRFRDAGSAEVRLAVPGRHNVANALAAIGACIAAGVPLATSTQALASFRGIRRRLETIGTVHGVTVIDDFAHNPDKIAATLSALHEFPGRLLILFQPHGFGPLKLMKDEFIRGFAKGLSPEDVLVMPEPVYYGGSTDRSVSSIDIVTGVVAAGRRAQSFLTRDECGQRLVELAQSGDRIVVMGARDDTLREFAQHLLLRLQS
ncbi:MAG: UDP-N-acetylmuramate--alanine ligase, partial [Alphaproteobacteria bacterium]|nr:UDP-N-acetylmuramate--alanine ligase [Alphaproteobacteria bacterium]